MTLLGKIGFPEGLIQLNKERSQKEIENESPKELVQFIQGQPKQQRHFCQRLEAQVSGAEIG